MRELVYYIAVSADGFIAGPRGEFDAFATDAATLAALFSRYPETCPAQARGPLGVTGDPVRFDAVIMGAATHQPAVEAGLTSAFPHLDQYVVSHRHLPEDPSLTRVSGDPTAFVRDLKRRPGRDIWLCGGADLAGQLIDEIDEFQLKLNPVLLGRGIPLTRLDYQPRGLRLVATDALAGGVLLNTYRRAEASDTATT